MNCFYLKLNKFVLLLVVGKIDRQLEQLSCVLNKPNLWDDSVFAGRISREHGGSSEKLKEVNGVKLKLLEDIDMLELAHEENGLDMLKLENFDSMQKLLERILSCRIQ